MTWFEVNVRLPLPPSDNDLWFPVMIAGKPRLAPTKEAKEFRETAQLLLRGYAQRFRLEPVEMGVNVTLTCFFASLSSDCCNRMKAAADACNEIVWVDDRQVSVATERKEFAAPGEPPYCVVSLEPSKHEELNRRLLASAERKAATRVTVRRPKTAPPKLAVVRDWRSLARPATYQPGGRK